METALAFTETQQPVVLEPSRLQIPSAKELKAIGEALSDKADLAVIENQEQLEAAVALGKEIKRGQKQVTEKYKDRKKYAKEVHSLFCALEKAEMDPFEEAEETIKDKIEEYDRKQEAIRKAEEEPVLREAEEKAKAQEEENRKKAEDEQLQLAADLEKAGNHEDAAVVMDTPIIVEPVVPVVQVEAIPEKPKVAGLSIPKRYTFAVVRPELIPREWMILDKVKIQKQVNATGPATRIPGIKIVEERSVSLRA